MIYFSRTLVLMLISCTFVACGSPNDADYGDDEYVNNEVADFDESTLPADFPRELIPASYHYGSYTKLGQVNSANFENREPVDETIRHYTELLGEPTTAVDGDGSNKTAQWQTTPWAVSIIGNNDESIIGFARMDN